MTSPIWYGIYSSGPRLLARIAPRSGRRPKLLAMLRRVCAFIGIPQALFLGRLARVGVRQASARRAPAPAETRKSKVLTRSPARPSDRSGRGMGNLLQVIGSTYRLAPEEYGGSVVWNTRALDGSAGPFGLLLRDDAVAYALRDRDDRNPSSPGQQAAGDALAQLIERGVEVHYVQEDAKERGLTEQRLIEGVKPLKTSDVPHLVGRYRRVWRSSVQSGLLVI